ncbi:MAG: DUF1844 domain-containing protein [candidate division Zixibacteria bacterium]|nr:DUF1844 domain-containing protein [candidate division Zixibacteria bacterium]
MTDPENKENFMFSQLVLSLQMGAMQQMGKMASPVTNKVERDMSMAQASIDMLGMLESKTKGNLTEDEEKLLTHILYELRMNYVEESKKGDQKQESETTGSKDVDSEDDKKEDESESGETTDS